MRACLLIVVSFFSAATMATGYARYPGYHSYWYPYGYRYYTEIELGRLRREVRDQRRIIAVEGREQRQELARIRSQLSIHQQISAEQACYYRMTGGLELCADLFDEAAARSDCEELVMARNPGCGGTRGGG